jgi:PAS domain S-box-containing protein
MRGRPELSGDEHLTGAADDARHDATEEQTQVERARLEAVLRQLPLAVIIAEAPSGRMILGNGQVERILRYPYFAAEDVEGYRRYQGLHPDGRPFEPGDWPLARALSSGEEISAEEIDIIRGDGTRGTIRVNAAPVRDSDGAITAGVVVFEDITDRRRNEAALDFLIEASAILAASLDYEATLISVADLIVPRMADWCVVDILDENGAIRRLAMKHHDPDYLRLLERLEERYPHRLDAPAGPARVLVTGEPEFYPHVSPEAIQRAARDDEHLRLLQSLGMHSYLCVPLAARGRTLGAISFVHSTSERIYTRADLALAEELGRRVAIAIDNARLFEAERASRARAESAQQRLAFLAEASSVLSSSLDFDVTLNHLARLAVPALADLCVVDIVAEDGILQRSAVAHADPDAEAWVREVSIETAGHIDSDAPLSRVLREGTPVLIREVTEEIIRRAVPEKHVARYLAAGYRSAVILPLIRHARQLGVLSFASQQPGHYTDEDMPFMGELADRAAAAIENAQLYRESQTAEARYRSLFEHAADAILVADAEGNYLDANPAALLLLGYGRDELLCLNVRDIVPNGPTWTDAEYTRYTASGYWHGELTLQRKDGSQVPVEATATVASLPDGAVYLSVIRDITERRATERMQREFMTMVTHDLKSPLTSIKGFAQLMQRRATYSQPAVDAIVTQTAQLERLINDMLDAARLEAGQAELRRSKVDLVSLGRTVIEFSQALTQQHTLRIVTSDESIIGWWDQDRLAQVMQNLLSNAIKYSPGGDIVMSIELRRTSLSDEAVVSVKDQGIGIPDEALPRVFERFYRHENAERGQQGLGLGLYISRSLVEAHGGRIGVESTQGQGTTFHFSLPLTGE